MKAKMKAKWLIFFLSGVCLIATVVIHLRDAGWFTDNPGEWFDAVREGGNESEVEDGKNESGVEEIYRKYNGYILIDNGRWFIVPPTDPNTIPDFEFRVVPDFEQYENVPEII